MAMTTPARELLINHLITLSHRAALITHRRTTRKRNPLAVLSVTKPKLSNVSATSAVVNQKPAHELMPSRSPVTLAANRPRSGQRSWLPGTATHR